MKSNCWKNIKRRSKPSQGLHIRTKRFYSLQLSCTLKSFSVRTNWKTDFPSISYDIQQHLRDSLNQSLLRRKLFSLEKAYAINTMQKVVVSSVWTIVGILLLVSSIEALWCDRTPTSVNVAKTPGDNGFKIIISGDPEKPDKYIPGAVYTVRLQGPGNQYTVEKFAGFLLVAEPTDDLSPEASAGSFQLTSDSLARFSEYCPHAVKHASELPKAEVQVRWIAPPVANGCVSFRATIIKNKGQWFMDDGDLTKQLCPETEVGDDENEDSEPCCACDEAKYELTFEGLWSPLTHPKDFPADAWSAHFSDIVGASHSSTFRFWQHNAASSDGLRQLAEIGDSKDLERELKDESGNIRTIIKARGLRHPNFFGHKTFAVFRTDKSHNLISLVSKIAPSPDWFVGVSGLNLCLRNCSWVSSKLIPLYPWDAGTDSGITYLSDKSPTIPRDRIRRIVWEKDSTSPFNDPSGNTVKPFARLRIQKQRAYERPCEEGSTSMNHHLDWEEEDSDEEKPECSVGEWSERSSCSVTCGRGFIKQRRQYLDPKAKDYGCRRKLIQEEPCDAPIPCNGQMGSNSNGYGYTNGYSITSDPGSSHSTGYGSPSGYDSSSGVSQFSDDPCAVKRWNPWGSCSKPCGQGIRRRRREFVNPSQATMYSCSTKLIEEDRCEGVSGPNCNEQEQVPPGCETTEWGIWEPCSVTQCGRGSQIRRRMYAEPGRAYSIRCNASLMDSQTCTGQRADCGPLEALEEICSQPMDPGRCAGSYTKWYFDMSERKCLDFKYTGCSGNTNLFGSKDECEQTCSSLTSNTMSSETIMLRNPSYGNGMNQYGNPYTNNLAPPKPFKSSSHSTFNYNDSPIIHCEVSDWGPWSKCSVDCGRGHKYRTRYIKVFPQNGGTDCPKLEHRRKCTGTFCPTTSTSNQVFHNNKKSSSNRHPYQQYGNGYESDNYAGYDGYVN